MELKSDAIFEIKFFRIVIIEIKQKGIWCRIFIEGGFGNVYIWDLQKSDATMQGTKILN